VALALNVQFVDLMLLSLADHIEVVCSDISDQLLSSKNLQTLLEFAKQFPYDITRDFGFESHLSVDEPFIDLLFCVTKESEGARILAGGREIALPFSLQEIISWKNIQRFCKNWLTTGTLFNKYIDLIWLEFDFKDSGFDRIPKMFFQIANQKRPEGEKYEAFLIKILEALAQEFYGTEVPDRLRTSFRNCVINLPEQGEIYHFGLLLKPKLDILRLVALNFQMASLRKWLESLYWRGNYTNLEELIKTFFCRFDYTVYDVDLDLNGEVLSKIGIECYFSDFRQPVKEPGWKENMDWISAEGWALVDKKDGFLDFSGQYKVSHFYRLNYLNSVNHIKVNIGKSPDIMLKGYFGTYVRTKT